MYMYLLSYAIFIFIENIININGYMRTFEDLYISNDRKINDINVNFVKNIYIILIIGKTLSFFLIFCVLTKQNNLCFFKTKIKYITSSNKFNKFMVYSILGISLWII